MKSYQILLTFLTLTHLLVAKPSKSDGGFISLFDGKTLDGWTQRNGTATYKVVDNNHRRHHRQGKPKLVPLHKQIIR